MKVILIEMSTSLPKPARSVQMEVDIPQLEGNELALLTAAFTAGAWGKMTKARAFNEAVDMLDHYARNPEHMQMSGDKKTLTLRSDDQPIVFVALD